MAAPTLQVVADALQARNVCMSALLARTGQLDTETQRLEKKIQHLMNAFQEQNKFYEAAKQELEEQSTTLLYTVNHGRERIAMTNDWLNRLCGEIQALLNKALAHTH